MNPPYQQIEQIEIFILVWLIGIGCTFAGVELVVMDDQSFSRRYQVLMSVFWPLLLPVVILLIIYRLTIKSRKK